MSRKLNVFMTVAALGCIVVGFNIASSDGGRAHMTRVDFDQVFADATAMPRRASTSPTMAMVNQTFADVTSPRSDYMSLIMTMVHFNPAPMPGRDNTPPVMTRAYFDQAFASATATPRRENTPPNREKLRNAGWKRILGSG